TWDAEFNEYKDSDTSSYREYYDQDVEASARRHAEIATYDYLRDLYKLGYRFDIVLGSSEADETPADTGVIYIEEVPDADDAPVGDDSDSGSSWGVYPGLFA
ncbi:MAG: hypothetical protein IJ087_11695, partial [Eggerthellaceae bacterium]|nr:hypothetical protein [Eggerthellaceae bacterium]